MQSGISALSAHGGSGPAVGLHDFFDQLRGGKPRHHRRQNDFAAARFDEADFFASPDIATLTRLLGGSARPCPRPVAQRPPYVVLQREGTRRPFFCIPGADENAYYFRELAQSLGEDQPFYVLRDPVPPEQRGRLTVEQVAHRFLGHIRTVQPAGPYFLGGHCFGGIVAYEAARQLHEQGERVSRLVLFEVPTPGYPRLHAAWRGYGGVAADFLSGRRRIHARDAFAHLRALSGLVRRRLSDAGLMLLRQSRLWGAAQFPGESGQPNVRAARIYTPKPHHGPVTCFLAADEPHSHLILENPLLGWRDYVRGAFEVRHTPGRAKTFFRHPHVRDLAAQLRTILDSPQG